MITKRANDIIAFHYHTLAVDSAAFLSAIGFDAGSTLDENACGSAQGAAVTIVTSLAREAKRALKRQDWTLRDRRVVVSANGLTLTMTTPMLNATVFLGSTADTTVPYTIAALSSRRLISTTSRGDSGATLVATPLTQAISLALQAEAIRDQEGSVDAVADLDESIADALECVLTAALVPTDAIVIADAGVAVPVLLPEATQIVDGAQVAALAALPSATDDYTVELLSRAGLQALPQDVSTIQDSLFVATQPWSIMSPTEGETITLTEGEKRMLITNPELMVNLLAAITPVLPSSGLTSQKQYMKAQVILQRAITKIKGVSDETEIYAVDSRDYLSVTDWLHHLDPDFAANGIMMARELLTASRTVQITDDTDPGAARFLSRQLQLSPLSIVVLSSNNRATTTYRIANGELLATVSWYTNSSKTTLMASASVTIKTSQAGSWLGNYSQSVVIPRMINVAAELIRRAIWLYEAATSSATLTIDETNGSIVLYTKEQTALMAYSSACVPNEVAIMTGLV